MESRNAHLQGGPSERSKIDHINREAGEATIILPTCITGDLYLRHWRQDFDCMYGLHFASQNGRGHEYNTV